MVTTEKVLVNGQEVIVEHYTHQELMDELTDILEKEQMTVEEFRAEGEADTLTDGVLRDLWLIYRPVLFDK